MNDWFWKQTREVQEQFLSEILTAMKWRGWASAQVFAPQLSMTAKHVVKAADILTNNGCEIEEYT